MPAEPLVFAEDLRIDVDGVPVCDGVTLRTRHDHVLVLGASGALFEALAGQRPVARGALRIRGTEAVAAVREGLAAVAPLDPPLPPKWTALEYVGWSSRLAGCSSRDARGLANDAIARVQLGALAALPLGRMVPHARRAVVLAAALATRADVIVVEDPLVNLPEEIARTWAGLLVQALDDRAWVVLAGRISLTSPLAVAAQEALVLSASRLDAQGTPAEIAGRLEHRFVARINGGLDALGTKLTERGASMDVQGAQVLLDLGESLTTAELLGMAAEADVTIVEMIPVARALS